MTQGARAKGKSKEVMSRAARWLFGVILVACWSSAAGLQIPPEPSGIGQSAASRTREARPAQPSVLPSDLPRIVASERHRQKPRPRAGGDFMPNLRIDGARRFDPRPRAGGDARGVGVCQPSALVSIHAPAQGATLTF